MLNIINKTPFDVSLTPATNAEGYDVLVVFVTASCQLENGKWRVCSEQQRAPMGDEPWDPEAPSSIRYPSQLTLAKPGTDIIINGAAIAPANTQTRGLEVGVEVGKVKSSVLVFGDRVWQHGRISSPEPFEHIPLWWENAYGGTELVGEDEVSYEHNALGKGWKPDKTSEEAFNGVLLPNIEWPHQRIQTVKDRVMPAGFGVMPVSSPERAKYAGTYDETWMKTRAPFAPADFNPRFFCAATPALQYPGYLEGNEGVRLRHLNKQSDVSFVLPIMKPTGVVSTLNKRLALTFAMQTLLIESEELLARMYWQANVPIERTLADMREIKVTLG